MSKAALDQMTRAVAIELIAEGVRVNSFYATAFSTSPGALPCGRIAEPSEIASVIAFLADRSQSSYIVGQTIVADGGTSIVLASNVASTGTQNSN
ncbi:unnamed protein product [Strongylus vulgaris]|uniref:SDR family oxidoreductase n=1 Tax=Strongylus vulgaris TaxID=40348 RepID=A0A3P7J6E4_STRVU|nr:unnamed protein product [Strongylus vulgaris]